MSTSAESSFTGDVLPGYSIDALIFNSESTRIYQAKRLADDLPVMLKSASSDYSSREANACLKNEFDIAKRFNAPCVIKAFSLEKHRNRLVLVLEDFGGDSLDNLVKTHSFSLAEVLDIAAKVCAGLSEIHAGCIIHKDITPANIVYNLDSGVLKIIDFGISSNLTREQAAVSSPRMVEASLPYMSPEQTGRMNRSIDFRTDFYSLGATLYWLLTGEPMFSVEESIEWFHCHIAKQPSLPSEIDVGIPLVVSDIIMKLLSKMAEDRYQSAQGILADIKRCQKQLGKAGEIDPFPLAQLDRPTQLQIPQRLYGREQEIAQLLDSFDRVSLGGNELVLVAGYSGIGKTCLIKELYKPITERGGHLVTGKFDQLNRDIPFSAISEAIRDLVRQLLTETEQKLGAWKDKILDSLGGNVRLIMDLTQELELIIGPQPDVPELRPIEAEQRFHLAFQNFIQIFCQSNSPLVIFLDDLQWADSASLKLFEMIGNPEYGIHNLLIIGAYRDNEVTIGHHFISAVKRLHEYGCRIYDIKLKPLCQQDIMNLLSDTLGVGHNELIELVALIEQKTAGNPFFTEEFLRYLYKEDFISFSHKQNAWEWDIDKIRNQNMTDNVVELMTGKLQEFPPPTLELLTLAACIGNRFELSVLSVVSEQFPVVVADRLKVAMEEGVIAAVGDAYQLLELEIGADEELTVNFAFSHDRIQQAAYGLLDDARKQKTHLKMGRLLLRSLSKEQTKERMFEICNHLNIGRSLIQDEVAKTQLSLMNLEAGKRAKASAAYPAAFYYLNIALELLAKDAWEKFYKKSLEIHVEAAESAYLSFQFDEMDRILTIGFEQARSLLDKVPLHAVKISSLIAQDEDKAALVYAKPVLNDLGYNDPWGGISRFHIIVSLLRTLWALRKYDMEALRNLPELTNPEHLAAGKIGTLIAGSALFLEPGLLPFMIFHSIRVYLKKGHSLVSLSSWAAFGMVLAYDLNKPEKGLEFGQLALYLVERFQAKESLSRVLHVHNALIRHWKEPLRETIEPLHDAFRYALEYGDFEYAVMASVVRLGNILDVGTDLVTWGQELEDQQRALRPLKNRGMSQFIDVYLQFWDNLRGNTEDPSILVGEYYDVNEKWNNKEGKSVQSSLEYANYEFSIWLCFLFGKHQKALELGKTYNKGYQHLGGFYRSARAVFISVLVRLAYLSDAQGAERRILWREFIKLHKKLKTWSEHNPDNFENKYLLVEAERLRVLGKELESLAYYDRAIIMSAQQGFIHEQALACELCGQMHMAADRKLVADTYLKRARDLYHAWGSKAKVNDLNQRFPSIMEDIATKTTVTTTSSSMLNVDLTALMKSLKAIASEKVHSHMLETIITTSVEFAGAERGLLILRNSEGELYIEGEFSLDKGASQILQSIPIDQGGLPTTLMHYVMRSQSSIVVHDAQQPFDAIHGLEKDHYVVKNRVRSILCLPLINSVTEKDDMIGLIYLENNLISNCFTPERFNTLEIIGIAAAGRLELSRKAAFDGLTGLFNHEYFQNMLGQVLSSAQRHHSYMSLILIDIDHFKQFNDTWGHQVGDLVLREVAQLIKATCRESDITARYGGEEMVVILPDTDQVDGLNVAEMIRGAIEEHRIQHDANQLRVTVSLGVSVLDRTISNKDELIRRADDALYKSKEKGRNCVTMSNVF